MSARREDELRLSGTVASNRAMQAELVHLARVARVAAPPRPARRGASALSVPFEPELAWLLACHHRSSSRVSWDLASSPASRLEPLHGDLVEVLTRDERLPLGGGVRLSVEVAGVDDFEAGPLQVRGAVKSALVDAARARGGRAEVDPDRPELRFVVRRVGRRGDRRTLLSLDLGGGPRHVRGHRVAQVAAPLTDTIAAQLVLLSRWRPDREPLVDPMAGGGTIAIEAACLATCAPVRQPSELGLKRLPALSGLPSAARPLRPDVGARVAALDEDPDAVRAARRNVEAAGLRGVVSVGQADARTLSTERVERALGGRCAPGVFALNPPHGRRLAGEEASLRELHRQVSRSLGAFAGWRTVVLSTHPAFLESWEGRPSARRPTVLSGVEAALYLFDPGRPRRRRDG